MCVRLNNDEVTMNEVSRFDERNMLHHCCATDVTPDVKFHAKAAYRIFLVSPAFFFFSFLPDACKRAAPR